MTRNVLIVEDDPMARKLFEIILKSSGRYHLEASIESASLAEFYCMTNPIDLILMDVCTALHASGLDAAARVKEKYPQIKIIIVTSQPNVILLIGQDWAAWTVSGTRIRLKTSCLRSWTGPWQESLYTRIRLRC